MGSQPYIYIYNICWRFNHQILGDVFWDIELSKGGTPQMARKKYNGVTYYSCFLFKTVWYHEDMLGHVVWGYLGTARELYDVMY